jgi:hypothetical protein
MASESEVLSDENYRRFAQKAIEKYAEKGMVIDSLMWSQVIGRYEAALLASQAARVNQGGPVVVLKPETWHDAKELLRRALHPGDDSLGKDIETFFAAVKS